MNALQLTQEHMDIMDHTIHRAPCGLYCGDSPAMQELVAAGYMVSTGRKSFVPEEYFRITQAGVQAWVYTKAGRAICSW